MSMEDQIRNKLETALVPVRMEIVDESADHAGHAGARAGGSSHFRILIISDKFDGLSRVQRQRLVNEALSEELEGPIHALAMKTLTPGEAKRQ